MVKRRTAITLKRWGGVLFMATVAAATALLLVAWRSNWFSAISELQGLSMWTSAGGALVGIALVASGVHGSKGARRWTYVLRYPPWWIGLPISGAIMVAAPRLAGSSLLGEALHAVWMARTGELSVWMVAAPAILVVTLWIVTSRLGRGGSAFERQSAETGAIATPDIMRDPEALMAWIRTDEHLEPDGNDAFAHSSVGGQLAQIIEEQVERGGQDAATALIGRVGSGKSSAISLCEKRFQGSLKAKTSVVFERVSLWPFDNTGSAAEGILKALVSALGQVADTQVVRDVPDRYLSTIGAAGGGWSVLARSFQVNRGSEATLGMVEEVLIAVDSYVVLVIEDLERFRNRPQVDGGDSNFDRLQPIEALIYLLRRTMRVSILLACDRSAGRFDPAKLVGTVVEMPLLEPDHVWRVVWKFRAESLKELEPSMVDPACSEARGELGIPSPGDQGGWRLLSGGQSPITLPQAAMVRALETPRVLKGALRECKRRWDKLKGEIDFDVLLSLCVLREADPGVFDGVKREYTLLLQGVSTQGTLEGSDRRVEDVVRELESHGSTPDEQGAVAVALITFAFKLSQGEDGSPGRPQGIAGPWGEHYWRRFTAVDGVADGQPTDQALIAELLRWKHSSPGPWPQDLLQWFVEGRLTRFGGLLDERDLLILMDEYFTARMAEESSEWGLHARGMPRPVIEMLRHRAVPEDALRGVAERLIDDAMTKNLPLVRELEAALSGGADRDGAILTEHGRRDLRRHVARAAEQAFSRDWTVIKNALKGGDPWVIHHIAFGIQVDPQESPNDLPWEDPATVAKSLLSLAEHEPEVGMPQLLCFCVERHVSIAESVEGLEPGGEVSLKLEPVAKMRVRGMFALGELHRVLKNSDYLPTGNLRLLEHLNELRAFVTDEVEEAREGGATASMGDEH